jgi:MYB-related transcription factor LHY
LEKEALVKGAALGQALDIDIPPPRPKRKPSNPYPRKTNVGTPTLHSGAKYGKPLIAIASSHGKQAMDFVYFTCQINCVFPFNEVTLHIPYFLGA